MENGNSPGSVLAVLSGLLRCRRKVSAAAQGLEARGHPEGPAVKSAHQSVAAVSYFFKVTLCIDCPTVLWTVWVLFFATAFLLSSLVSTLLQFEPKKKKKRGSRAQGKTKAFQRGSKKKKNRKRENYQGNPRGCVCHYLFTYVDLCAS